MKWSNIERKTDTVYAFYKNYITEMIGNEIFAKKLYEQYLTYCNQNYIDKPVSMTTFGKQIKSYGIEWRDRTGGRVYINITTDLERVYAETNIFDD